MLRTKNKFGGLISTTCTLFILRLSLDSVWVRRNPTLIVTIRTPSFDAKCTTRRRDDAFGRLLHDWNSYGGAKGAHAAVPSTGFIGRVTALFSGEIPYLNINMGYSLTLFWHAERSSRVRAIITHLTLRDPNALLWYLLWLDASVSPDGWHHERVIIHRDRSLSVNLGSDTVLLESLVNICCLSILNTINDVDHILQESILWLAICNIHFDHFCDCILPMCFMLLLSFFFTQHALELLSHRRDAQDGAYNFKVFLASIEICLYPCLDLSANLQFLDKRIDDLLVLLLELFHHVFDFLFGFVLELTIVLFELVVLRLHLLCLLDCPFKFLHDFFWGEAIHGEVNMPIHDFQFLIQSFNPLTQHFILSFLVHKVLFL